MIKKIRVPIVYECTGYVEVYAKDYETAYKSVQKNINRDYMKVLDNAKETDYIEDTLMIDCDLYGLELFNRR